MTKLQIYVTFVLPTIALAMGVAALVWSKHLAREPKTPSRP